ncbi:macrophage mannose receptor 1-like [Trichoplusia ni]|uniref:Macrophage mannose receptor 1-like n=1 Tax=Trichoplusia ni TaxID=7111 RepID=A0A7E5VXB5_TRINI|nr:macrophage mannose receptor 1-like [Trichoplusia ni]
MKWCLRLIVLILFIRFIESSFRCDYTFSTVAMAWFKHFVIPATWFDARLRCNLEGATLASPTTPEIDAEMTHILKNFFSAESEIFTGIHATFSQGDYYTIEGIPLAEISATWAEDEPNNLGNNESCITLNHHGDLADRSCEETRPYICYRKYELEKEANECGTVDSEYRLDTRTNKCYKFHTQPRTFWRANFVCSAEGGHLAIINSETEAKVLKELFAKYPAVKMTGIFWKDVAFIGFANWGEQGELRTIHGQTLWEAGYSKFSPGEPNNATTGEYCGAIYRTSLLIDLWCNNVYAFICEKDPKYPAVCTAHLNDANVETKS